MSDCLRIIAPLLEYAPDINLREMHWMDWVKQEMEWGFGITSKIYHHHCSFIFGQGSIDAELLGKVLSLLKEAKALLTDEKIFLVLSDADGFSKASIHFLWDHMGGQVAKKSPTETAFFWRKGEYAANIKLSWSHPSQSNHMLEFEQKCKKLLEPHALQGKAAYANYIDDTVLHWEKAYYGDNYEKLRQIKKMWDPDRDWHFPQAIGESKVRLSDVDGKLPGRWELYLVKNPSAIDTARMISIESFKQTWQVGRSSGFSDT
jgi:hypothetical protein